MTLKVDWQWHHFDDLTPTQMQSMFALRQEVFIVEQNCPYLDIDNKDQHAIHLLGNLNNKLVATLRVFERYPEYQNYASIGRICTHYSVRNEGIGRELVIRAIEFIENNFESQSIQIGAQYYLKKFYKALGFKQISEIYDEDGIEHILMLKKSC